MISARTMLAVLRHRTVAFLVVVAFAWAGWELFLAFTAPRRIDAALAPALHDRETVDVAVTLDFAPEDFHIRLFQTYGTVRGVHGTTVLISRVPPDDVRRIARYYWVRRIAPP